MEPTDRNRAAWERRHGPGRTQAIPQRVRDRLPPLAGLRVLHLQCGDGAAARVAAPGQPLLHGHPETLPPELLRGRFDLGYSGPGGLGAVDDLDAWAAGVHAALRPLGWLVVHDEHPVAAAVDAALHWRGDYFAGHGLGAVVTAVSQAGLTVRRLEEHPARRDAARRQDPRVPGEYLLRAERPAT